MGKGQRLRTARHATDVPVDEVLRELERLYPHARCELHFRNPFELLIATILSAQCTDKKVNEVTATLFEKYKRPEDYLRLTQEELEREIRGLGLYKNKSKNILATCRILHEKHNGEVPRTREELEACLGWGGRRPTWSCPTPLACRPSPSTPTCFAWPIGSGWPNPTTCARPRSS